MCVCVQIDTQAQKVLKFQTEFCPQHIQKLSSCRNRCYCKTGIGLSCLGFSFTACYFHSCFPFCSFSLPLSLLLFYFSTCLLSHLQDDLFLWEVQAPSCERTPSSPVTPLARLLDFRQMSQSCLGLLPLHIFPGNSYSLRQITPSQSPISPMIFGRRVLIWTEIIFPKVCCGQTSVKQNTH